MFNENTKFNEYTTQALNDQTTIWNLVKHYIKPHIKPKDFKAWIQNSTKIKEISDSHISIIVNNQFTKKWINDNALSIIQQALQEILGKQLAIKLIVMPSEFQKLEANTLRGTILDPNLIKKNKLEQAIKNANLNKQFTFENFIVGPSNQLAYASAVAVAETPGNAYNPLFIYGPVGTGKTHLLQAIAHKVLQKDVTKKVIYMTSEDFLNELVKSLKQKQSQEFKNKYRNMDILIIDDIQFISGWQTTQNELFHTFNSLYLANKQIVFASDRPPTEIKDIAERLRSRFQGGMVVDIMPPDLETKIAILQKLNAKNQNILETSVLHALAEHSNTNIRQLIGSFNKISNYAKVLNKKITQDDLFIILKHELKASNIQINPKNVLKKVAEYFLIDVNRLISPARDSNTALARQVAMYILRQELKLTLKDTAYALNRKDHTTVIHAVNKVLELMQKDKNLKNKVLAISSELKN